MADTRDLLAIATDGCICPPATLPFHMATSGLLVPFAIVVIEFGSERGGAQGFGYILTDDKEKREFMKKLEIVRQDDEDIMLIIQIFMHKWN